MPNPVSTWNDAAAPERITSDDLRAEYPGFENINPHRDGGTSDTALLITQGFQDFLQTLRQLGFDPTTAQPESDTVDLPTLRNAWIYHTLAAAFRHAYSSVDDSNYKRWQDYTTRALAAAGSAKMLDGTGYRSISVRLDR